MSRYCRRPFWFVWLLLLAYVAPACSQPPETKKDQPAGKSDKAAKQDKTGKADEAPKFLRLVRNDKGDITAMQTAVVRYVPKEAGREGLQVELIGAVHIGEKAYYDELNKLFEGYDALLYELVAPEGTTIKKGETSSRHPIGAMQNGMKDLLGLEHQLACIDYNQKNFVHADMSPDQFEKAMADRGESIWTMVFRAMGAGMAKQSNKGGTTSEFEILLALFDKERSDVLKRILAEQFEDLDDMTSAFNGPDGSAILTERNKTALAVLKKEIEGGKKKIGVFYGAAHLPDMEKRLSDDFGLKRADEKWVTAWTIKPKK